MDSYKKIISFLGISCLIFHFSITAIYLSDGSYTPASVNYWVGQYMIPVFHQNWRMFAPEPPLWNIEFEYKVQMKDGTWSNWNNPKRYLIKKHQNTRFLYYGKEYTLYLNLAKNLHGNYMVYRQKGFKNGLDNDSLERFIQVKWEDDAYYKLAVQFFIAESEKKFGDGIEKIAFRYVFNYPEPFHENIEKELEIIEFPVFDLNTTFNE